MGRPIEGIGIPILAVPARIILPVLCSVSLLANANGQLTRETDDLDTLPGTDVTATGDLLLVEVLRGVPG